MAAAQGPERPERLFVALAVPPGTGRRLVARFRRDLGPAGRRAVRASAPGDLHLTLAFLGDVGPELRRRVERELAGALSGLPAPRLVLGPTGAFGRRGRERVLWVAPREAPGSEGRLAALHAASRAALERAGWRGARSAEPFHPHVTLGRVREGGRGRRRPPLVLRPEVLAREHGLAWEPAAVELVASALGRAAPPGAGPGAGAARARAAGGSGRYRALARYALDPA